MNRFVKNLIHLLEDGIDFRYIHELLGHKSSKTTEVYMHVSSKDFRRVDQILLRRKDNTLWG